MFNRSDKLICKDCDSMQTGNQVRTEIKHGKEVSHCKNCDSDYLVELVEDVRNSAILRKK